MADDTRADGPLSDKPTCRHRRDDGTMCLSHIGLSRAGLCMAHDPERAERMAEARRSGVRSIRRRVVPEGGPEGLPPPPKSLADAMKFASWLTHAVCLGIIDARTLTSPHMR
jgi:hypothetical protein